MTFKGFSQRDTSILKGVGILSIVFHNFFHWTYPAPGENEFDFAALRVENLFRLLGDKPGECVNLLISYLGHYGVQLFLLVSGFGLAVSMLRKEKDWGSFMLDRFKKLYPLLLTGIVVCFIGLVVMEKRVFSANEWREIGYKLLFIHTLLPNSGLSINGPWWFFGLILQLYLVFPLLFRWIRRWGWKAFAAICLCSYAMIFLFRYVLDLHHGTILMMNAPGHLPEFCLGVLLAFNDGKKIPVWWLLVSVVVFCLGNVFAVFYPFTFLSLSLILVFAYQGLKSLKIKKAWLGNALAYFGGISMLLFAVHGYFRVPFITLINSHWQGGWGKWGAALLFFAFSWLLAVGAKPLYDSLTKLFGLLRPVPGKVGKLAQRGVQVLLVLFFAWVTSYYVWQNLAYKSRQPVAPKTAVEVGTVQRSDTYVSLGKYPLDKNHPVLQVRGSVELQSADAQAMLPLLIIAIPDACWKSYELKTLEDGWLRYDFNYVFSRPFVKSIKGKDLSVYFWNRQGSEMLFRNVDLQLLTQ